jgi:hypothetical protein
MQTNRMGRPEEDSTILQDELFAGQSVTRLMLTPLCNTAVISQLNLSFREEFGSQLK